MITDRNALRPYNDTPPDPDNLGGMLANAAHGHKADPLLDSLRAAIEGRPDPATLAAAEDKFKAEMSTAATTTTDDWS